MILKYFDYKNSNVDNQLFLDDNLICNDLRNCKMFLNWLDLELISKKDFKSNFYGEYTIYTYKKK